MLDLMGAMVLTAAIVVNLNATITVMPLSPVPKLTTVAVAGLWIGLAIALATTGIYNSTATPVPVVGVMAGLPVIAVGAAALLFSRVREALLALPVALLVGLNPIRIVLGGFMVLLALQGRLSGPFPQSAGWGDVIVGLMAIPLAAATARKSPG
jgi:phosphate/sulfate permease